MQAAALGKGKLIRQKANAVLCRWRGGQRTGRACSTAGEEE